MFNKKDNKYYSNIWKLQIDVMITIFVKSIDLFLVNLQIY